MRWGALLMALLIAGSATAEGWAGFYVSTTPRAPTNTVIADINHANIDRSDVCIAEILNAQRRHNIPDNLLLAIGLQEAGRSYKGRTTVWPYAVNAAGVGRMFDTRAAAQAWVRQRQAAGVRSIDVGCMQINLRWHPKAFSSLDEGFDPAANVDYAARFLKRLRNETGSWRGAAGSYHSRNPTYKSAYLNRLDGNISRANAHHAKFVERIGTGPRRAIATPPASETPRAVAGVGWGGALSGGARSTLYSQGTIRPLLAGAAK